MTDSNLAPLSAAPAAPAAVRSGPGRSSRTAWAAGVVTLLALAGLWQGWSAQQRIQQLESELVKRQQDSQAQAQEARLMAKQAQELARDAAARATLLETRLAEVALQRGQIEDLVKSMSRSRDENLVVDIEAALRLALQQATLTGNAEPLVSALQTADDRLARAQQPRLDGVRRAVAKDLDKVKATRVSDLSSLVIRMDEAIRLVDDAPLLSQPHRGSAAAGQPPHGQPQAAGSKQAAALPWSDQMLHWGRHATQTVWQEARTLVRLTRIDQPEAMLIAPDQAFFLRENLKLRLLNARLGLLSRQNAAAADELRAVQSAVSRYFDMQSRKTQLLRNLLGDVIAQSPQTQVPKPDDTLAALSTVAGGR